MGSPVIAVPERMQVMQVEDISSAKTQAPVKPAVFKVRPYKQYKMRFDRPSFSGLLALKLS